MKNLCSTFHVQLVQKKTSKETCVCIGESPSEEASHTHFPSDERASRRAITINQDRPADDIFFFFLFPLLPSFLQYLLLHEGRAREQIERNLVGREKKEEISTTIGGAGAWTNAALYFSFDIPPTDPLLYSFFLSSRCCCCWFYCGRNRRSDSLTHRTTRETGGNRGKRKKKYERRWTMMTHSSRRL